MKDNLGRKVSKPTASSADAGYTRLHISPLDAQLLKVIVPAAVLPNARRISYHTVQTFPDRPYGFVDLPSADADKIRNKLNGAVLRGSKIRIEPAKPDNMPEPFGDAAMHTAESKPKKAKREKKRKRDPQEIAAIELEDGRKIKRGWTVTPEEAASKKKKEKEKSSKSKGKDKEKKKKRREPESLYTEGPECLVKTRLPPNKSSMVDDDGASEKKKSKKGNKRDIVVHEFERNTKYATFLKSTNSQAPEAASTSFVDGKGWVDESGVVVEDVKSTRPTAFPKLQISKRSSPEPVRYDDTSSSSGSSSEDESDLEASPSKQPGGIQRYGSPVKDESMADPDSARPKSSSSARSLTIRIPPATPSSEKVHPLEALYKRQQQGETVTNKESATSEPFTFFGDFGGDEEDDEVQDNGSDGSPDKNEGIHEAHLQGPQPPMTPFTKQDLEWRNIRSAAPTPDTAHPSRVRLWSQRSEEDDILEDDDEDGDVDMAGRSGATDDEDAGAIPANPSTDFQKIFWERRAELNRSWKKRRRLSAKEKRYRDNKARADRAI